MNKFYINQEPPCLGDNNFNIPSFAHIITPTEQSIICLLQLKINGTEILIETTFHLVTQFTFQS